MSDQTFESKLLSTAAANQWKEIGVKNHHGICIPLFAVHSQKSCGIGEYDDLYALIDWCKDIGLDVIQLLPLNDTGLDYSPYSAISAIALNPINLTITSLPYLERVPDLEAKIRNMQQWNNTARVNIAVVRKLKFAFLFQYYQLVYQDISQTEEYTSFVNQQKWLESYALFCALKEKFQWENWENWPNQYKSPSEDFYSKMLAELSSEVHFYQFLQFLCFGQLAKVKVYAIAHGVYLKGDIPILISRDSADVWAFRKYFLIQYTAGAPPDMFSELGQNWGFPVYDWEALEKSNYDWWAKRLKFAENLYHIYRIDHVVGFFRIWAIPQGKPGKDGQFFPSNQQAWIDHGQKIMLMMLRNCSMLPIGEDLGIVPLTVRQCLFNLGICGTKVMRWERRWDEDKSFIPINQYNPESMTTVSTHDSDTLQLWWKHAAREAKDFCSFKGWDYQPFLSLERHQEILKDSHQSSSLFHINLLQEYLSLFSELVSANPNDERINIPGKVLDTNWTYRFKPSNEELVQHQDLKNKIRYLIS